MTHFCEMIKTWDNNLMLWLKMHSNLNIAKVKKVKHMYKN